MRRGAGTARSYPHRAVLNGVSLDSPRRRCQTRRTPMQQTTRDDSDEQARRGPGFGLPPPDTGRRVLDLLARAGLFAIKIERRIDPLIRPLLDALFRDWVARLVTRLINWQRRGERRNAPALAEERIQPQEEQHLQEIIDTFTAQLHALWKPGYVER